MEIINFILASSQLLMLYAGKQKEMDFGSFSMKMPDNWNYIEARGIDSFVGKISLDAKDTIYFDYGMYSNSLKEELGFIITKDSVFEEIRNENINDTLNRYVLKFYAKRDTLNFEKLYKTEESFEMINNLEAKIITPKKNRIGTTGVFFENTSTKSKGMRFQISGYNLSQKNQKAFLKVIRTIKFKN